MSARELSFARTIGYAVGSFPVGLLPTVLSSWLGYFYMHEDAARGKAAYVDGVTFGVLWWIAARVVEAAANPVVGHLSDGRTGPSGRRRPFILAGAVPMALAFALLWFPPESAAGALNALWLGLWSAVFFAAFVVVVNPYLALLPEIARGEGERMRLSVYMGTAEVVGVAVGFAAAAALLDAYGIVRGAPGPVLIAGSGALLGLVCAWAPLVGLSEPPAATGAGEPFTFREAVVETFRSADFRAYVIALSAFRVGVDMVMFALPFLVAAVLHKSEGVTGAMQGLLMIGSLVLFPAVDRAAARFGMKRVVQIGLWMLVAVLPLTTLVGPLSWLGAPFRPLTDAVGLTAPGDAPGDAAAAAAVLAFVLAAVPVAVFNVVPRAMLARIIDADAARTGRRREAVFNGVEGLVTKFASGFGVFAASSVLFALFGDSAERPWGIVLSGPVAGLFLLFAVIAFRGYRG